MKTQSKYFWPASKLTSEDMAMLHRAREAVSPRTPINLLIAQAVRASYANTTRPTNHGYQETV